MTPTKMMVMIIALVPALAHARKNGIAGESGQGDATCNDCHSGGAAPSVQLRGPTALDTGMTATYQLVITSGAAKVGGLGVSVDDPGASIHTRSESTRAVGATQLVHNAPAPFVDGELRFEFELTAPSHPATLTIYAAGNSCNGDGEKLGDAAGLTTLKVAVMGGGGGGGGAEHQETAVPQTGCSYEPHAHGGLNIASLMLLVFGLCISRRCG
jgi:hypothetical protein